MKYLEFFGGRHLVEKRAAEEVASALQFLLHNGRLPALQRALGEDLPWNDLLYARGVVGPRLYSKLAWPLNLSMSALLSKPRAPREEERKVIQEEIRDRRVVFGHSAGRTQEFSEFDPVNVYLYLRAVEEWEAIEKEEAEAVSASS